VPFLSGFEAGRLEDMNTTTDSTYSSPHPRVRVLVADDHEVMRLGIRNLLEVQPGWSVCAEASNGQEAVDKTVQFHPDVIIMDISMPVMNGIDAANQITRTQPQIPVILFSLHLSDDLYPHFRTEGIRGATWFRPWRRYWVGGHSFPTGKLLSVDRQRIR
jgi:CheY-like chemotaxis protein